MKKYKSFMTEGSTMMVGKSYTQDADKRAVYNDMKPADRKALDDYCMAQFSNRFLNCSFEEQSTARSYVWAENEDPDEIKAQNDRNAKM